MDDRLRDGLDMEIQKLLEHRHELPENAESFLPLLMENVGHLTKYRSVSGEALCAVAGSSVANAHLLAKHGIGNVVLHCLERRASSNDLDMLSRLVLSLTQNCPKIELLEMENWIRPLMCALADGLVEPNQARILSAMSMAEAMTSTGHRRVIQALKRTSGLWTVIKNMASVQDIHVQQKTALLLRSLIDANIRPTVEEMDHFQRLLLEWIVEGPSVVSKAASAALTKTIDDPGSSAITREWLSHILIALSSHPGLISDAVDTTEPSVIPSYIRYVADEILGRPAADPPDHTDIHHYPSVEPLMLDWEEDHSEDTAVSRGLSILSDFAANSLEISTWLIKTEILELCLLLTRKKAQPLKEQQQIARLIAILARSNDDGTLFLHWLSWLKQRIDVPDLMLASNSLRAVMHIQKGHRSGLTFCDGIHFFHPIPQMADQLAMQGRLEEGTEMDVVFVHGIRGGPFITWRTEGSSETHSTRDCCWPSDWFIEDLPSVHPMSVEFAAPVSSWEGGSGSLKETALAVFSKLKEAGIGHRPLVFVAHSMGGIIVKEMLVRALDDEETELVDNIRGIVFISTPHHGVWLAHLVWGLRHVGACPAPSMNTMKPGPYLENLNNKIKQWVLHRRLPVLNFAETRSTDVLAMIPKLHVVPFSSAFPGYGRSIALPNRDHITSCKPKHKTDVFYQSILAFLNDILNRQ